MYVNSMALRIAGIDRNTPDPQGGVIRRDEQDCRRAIAPLRQAEDAVLVDTTRLNLEESLEALLAAIKERTGR